MMSPCAHTGPAFHRMRSDRVSSGGVTSRKAGSGWHVPVWLSLPWATADQCRSAWALMPGRSSTWVGRVVRSRTCRVGTVRPRASSSWTVVEAVGGTGAGSGRDGAAVAPIPDLVRRDFTARGAGAEDAR